MALSLDDRLLGEKVHNYCSSSEDEGEDNDDNDSGSENQPRPNASDISPPNVGEYPGYSTNTGPKGVMTDWRRYKQMETERRVEQEREKLDLAKKLTLTCRSHLDEEKEKEDQLLQELEEFEDGFLKEYRQRRIVEMRAAFENMPKFGHVITLTKDSYIEAIDAEKPIVTVIVHIYEDISACDAMNGCLVCLAQEYPTLKFCKIRASETKLSGKFAVKGVPALLVYKNKELIGNFIRLSDDLGEDFFATDVESFLLEHGMLPDKSLKMGAVRNSAIVQSDSDSDFEVD